MLDENGYLTLTGRLKEMINRGGEKISPREIDEVLLAPSVGGRGGVLRHAASHLGRGGGGGGAAEGARSSEADLLAFCKERLADFKRPKKIHITDAIPRTATGKIQRRVVAQHYAQQ